MIFYQFPRRGAFANGPLHVPFQQSYTSYQTTTFQPEELQTEKAPPFMASLNVRIDLDQWHGLSISFAWNYFIHRFRGFTTVLIKTANRAIAVLTVALLTLKENNQANTRWPIQPNSQVLANFI
ncbi:hypothetical protein [Coprococcus comes]|uniref:Uncharacterized protein n=1 Tax=Coprococcus comes TaxID=410072 RepID=A0A414QF00_9FIRM|nr:hypothetical protein [Coprococcus comes]RHF79360.1 hypothetical protein DW656_17045 [Coprococcus comes]